MFALLAERVTGGSELVSCRPAYVRYKPGTSFLVEYRLGFAGRPLETIAHVKLFAGAGAAKLWAKEPLRRLAETVENPAPLVAAALLPELAAVLQTFPVDLALPTLVRAASRPGVELVRYKPGRKALLRYRANGETVYGKIHEDGRGATVAAAARQVAAAGVPTARPLGYSKKLCEVVHAAASGEPLRSLQGDAFSAGVAAAGATLAALHATTVASVPRHTWADEAAEVAVAARAVATLRPDLGESAARLAADVIDRLAELPPLAVTSHGDFSDDQVLVGEAGAVLLDLDEIRLAHPWLDVGNFLGHLSLRGEDDARAAFLDGYGPSGPAALEAGALLKLAVEPFRRLEADWPAGVAERLELARGRLPSRAGAAARAVDAALPQLAALESPTLVATALEHGVFGEQVAVRAAEIVRHKRGRRAVLRFDVELGANRRPQRLYGKTYASDRGPRVFATLQSLAEHGLALPEPVAFLPRLRLILQRELHGSPARGALLAGNAAAAAQIAEVVHALHGLPVRLAREHGLDDELRVLRARIDGLAEQRGRAARCLGRLEGAADASWHWRFAPVHRDLYHDQVLLDGDRPALLDLDDAAMSEPALDVANFLAHLRLLQLEEPLRRAAVAAAADAFRRRSAELDPELDPQLVRLLEAATLLRLACIHSSHRRRLLRECEALLPVEPQPERRARSGSRLARALDEDAVLELVTGAVEERLGTRPTACRCRLLRQKKGRIVVLYRLETRAGALELVGKWFRDGRAAATAEIHRELRRHGFAGGDLAVPEPVLCDPALRVLFTTAAPGPSLRAVLDDDPEQARRAGAWLARLHACGAELPARRPRRAWSPELAPLGAALERQLPERSGVPTHGDFAAADVLVPAEGPTVVVDLDDAAAGDPAADVANFEATLELRRLRRYGSPAAFAAATASFRAGYAANATMPPVSPAVEAYVWLRLAQRNLTARPEGVLWRHALARAEAIGASGTLTA